MQNLIINITQENFSLLENENFGCFILPQNLTDEFKNKFVAEAHKKGKIGLISGENAAEEYLKSGADGIILDLSKEENPQKPLEDFQKKNPHALLGVISRNRRHEAMLISECEPDFIIFKLWNDGYEKTKELLDWYGEFFLIQYAVMPVDFKKTDEIKADFIIKNDFEV